jgi:hypothetical protein
MFSGPVWDSEFTQKYLWRYAWTAGHRPRKNISVTPATTPTPRDGERFCLPLHSVGPYPRRMSRRPAPPPKRYADNVQDRLVSLNELLLAPGTYLRVDNAPGKMDYVQSRKRAAPSSPKTNSVRKPVQLNRKSSGRSKSAEMQDQDDPTDKKLYAVRREIHNRLGRLEKLEGLLATLRMSLAELELRERELTFDLWAKSPTQLAELNESTRRWRRRKSDV